MSWDLCHIEREISETQKRETTEIHNMFQDLAREDAEEDRDSIPPLSKRVKMEEKTSTSVLRKRKRRRRVDGMKGSAWLARVGKSREERSHSERMQRSRG
eukprot:12416332-Karenia_brevis.AAC.1